MQGLNLMILLVALGTASACKYYCHIKGTFKYDCCDDGNSYYNPEEEAVFTKPDPDNCFYWCQNPKTTHYECCDDGTPNTEGPADCYYYCKYDSALYCCGDVSQPIPESHAEHEGSCADEDKQVCKKTGIFLLSKKNEDKTSEDFPLVAGEVKELPFCASDGYCGKQEKCCPSKCIRGHTCMKTLDDEDDE